VFIIGSGALLSHPPSIVDAITGATPKAKAKAAAAEAQRPLAGRYILFLGAEISRDGLIDVVGAAAVGEQSGGKLQAPENELRLAVPDGESALGRYAEKLCARLDAAGLDVEVATYSDTMFVSRAVSGRFDLLLTPDGLFDTDLMKNADAAILLDGAEMERAN
jgi:hypothetical protein